MTLSPAEYEFILRRDFMSFVERAFYELNPQTRLLSSPHLELIASKLEACRLGSIRRLIVAVPPRYLKSILASVAFPAWCLGHDPASHIICASYGQDLADKLARDCRNVMLSAWYQRLFRARLASRVAVHDFATTEQGTRMATSVGGVLTGRGADIIIIDDALKPEEALSETRRSAVNEWYDNTLLSRLNDKTNGCIILIMQRLHQEDLVGHVLDQEPWEVVSLPAIAEEDESHLIESPLGIRWFRRKAGEVLHPEREDLQTLARIRETMGEYNFSSQYQQNPVPLGGNMVKVTWLRYYDPSDLPERFDLVLQSWDTANKSNELSDYSVCTTWGVYRRHFYLLDVCRQRLNYPELKRKVGELARRFGTNNVLIEDKASGTQLIQDLQAEHITKITPYQPPSGSDKIMRMHAQTAHFENGFVLLPRSAPWLGDYVKEITGFPGTKYDDQVDSTTQALDHLRPTGAIEIWRRLGEGSTPLYRR
jgi:predicted phage terminase large subunit-like protein